MQTQGQHRRCTHCRLPLPARPYYAAAAGERLAFCCSGCGLVYQITGELGEEGEASFWLAKLGLGCFFAMNVMTLSLLLYSDYFTALDPVLLPKIAYVSFALTTPVMLILGWPFVKQALQEVASLSFSMESLVALGSVSAYTISTYATFTETGEVYFDTATMILILVTLGRFLEASAKATASAALQQLLDVAPQQATLLCAGQERRIPVTELHIGHRVVIRPGERIPIDGIVLEGTGAVDESTLTGEARPVFKAPGERLMGATVNVEGRFIVEVTQTSEETVFARVVQLMEEAQARRGPLHRLVDRIAAVFVPSVTALAVLTFLFRMANGLESALLSALAVLLVACPCPLGLATAMATWVGLSRAASCGAIVRSGEALERLAELAAVCFDKTGTLTVGHATPVAVQVEPCTDAQAFLSLCASLEHGSEHTLGQSLVAAATAKGLPLYPVLECTTHAGLGVEGVVAPPNVPPYRVTVGSERFLKQRGITIGAHLMRQKDTCDATALTVILGAWDKQAQGLVAFGDRVRPEARDAIAALKGLGLDLCILSGDQATATRAVAEELGITSMRATLLPPEKVEAVRAVQSFGTTAVVGDGINDAPALATAAVGIAMGSGTALAKETADISIISNDLRHIPWLIGVARATRRIIRGNLFWAFFYNTMGLVLAVLGVLTPLLAALAMTASSLFVVANSLRLRKIPAPGCIPDL
ncbi:putative copper-exporting P-type ATPase V [Candidatus Entotheonellaceae bacterium PAL068K]